MFTGKVGGSFFACGCPIVRALFVEKILLSPSSFLGPLVKNQLPMYVWVYFWTLFCGIVMAETIPRYTQTRAGVGPDWPSSPTQNPVYSIGQVYITRGLNLYVTKQSWETSLCP